MSNLSLLLLATLASLVNANSPPFFINDLSGTTIREDTAPGTVIGSIQARDPEGFGIQYRINSAYFIINSRSGAITLIRNIDYETTKSVAAEFRINSYDDNVQIVSRTVTFAIIDANDVAPVFTLPEFTGSVDEASPNGTVVVASIVATDVDVAGPGLTVVCDRASVASEFAGVCDVFEVLRTAPMQVQSWTGSIVLRGNVVYREKTAWQLPLKASDGRFVTIGSAEIRINDVQNEPPIFVTSMNVQTFEQFEGAILTVVQAIDQDRGNPRPIMYSLVTNPGGLFSVETNLTSGLGTIINIKDLDRDTDPVLSDGFAAVIIKASEVINETGKVYGNDSLTTATATLIITVLGINNKAPTFSQQMATVSMPENIPTNSPVPGLSLTVRDLDQGVNASFIITLLTHTDIFTVEPTSGQELAVVSIRVKNTSTIDYDLGAKVYVLNLQAREDKSPAGLRLTGSSMIAIVLVDVNDLSPVFNQSSFGFRVSELASEGEPVTFGIEATDADSGAFGTAGIRYSLIGNGADKFEIRDPTRAVVSVRSCTGVRGKGPLCLDRELTPTYTLFLVATDNLGTGNANSTSIVFTVLDENDNAPIFDSATGTYEFFINEGQTSGSPVFQVSATDADSALKGNNVIQYSIVGENSTTYNGLWRIVPGGIIVASRPVDYEAIPGLTGSFVFFAQAQDSSSPYYKAYERVVINVIDLNDNAPTFTVPSPVTLSVLETMNGTHYLTTLKATDGDLPTTANGRVSYSIKAGAQGKFTINETSGDLYTTASASFDFDVQPVYVLDVFAEDNGSPRLQAALKVNVRVIDTNNRFPYFLMNPKLVQVYENAIIGSYVTQMTAVDQDSTSLLNFTALSTVYKKLDGTVTTSNATLFDLSPSSANVTVLNKLNRDIVSEVTMLVHVADLNATVPQTATATLIIAILDINDRAPEFVSPWTLSSPYYNMSIDEEQPIGSFVVVLTATDPDGPLSGYYIVNDPLSAFSISSSGTVTLRGRLDFEAVEATSFTVVAVDSGVPRLSATATVSITINNVNDMSPTVLQSQYQFSLVETYGPAPSTPLSGPNRFLGVVNATDADKGDYGLVTFNLADPRFFLVSSTNGAEVYANGTAFFDREVTSQIVLQLQVSDSPANPAVQRFVSAPIYVQIVDVNDNAPRFLVSDYYATVGNNAPTGILLVSVLATDIDINNTLTYSLIASADSVLFSLNSSTGQFTSAQSLTTRAGNILLTAIVSDGVHNASCLIHITILESSRSPPTWISPSSGNNTLQVLEEQYLGLIITRLQARADNSSSAEVGRLTYGILYGDVFVDETPQFKVNPVTGVLTANQIFDRERLDQYLVNLAVRDGRSPPLESRLFITVQILDVDDNTPVFDRSSYAFSVAESVSVNASVGTVRATDRDIGANAIVRYSIVLGNTGNAFRIDPVTGEIFVNTPLDRETTADYSLQVGSGSSGSVAVASVVTVNISIGDVNDNVPAFTQSIFSASLPYDSPFNSLVVGVTATDPDYGDNALLSYSLTDDRGLMSINSAGRVTLVRLPTSSSATAVTARLSVWNPTRPSALSNTTLRVWFTSSAEVAVLTVTQTPDWVTQHLDMYHTQLTNIFNSNNVFISTVRYHLSKDGEPDLTRTDLLVSASKPDLTLYTGAELSKLVQAAMSSGDSAASLRFLKLQDAAGASDPGAAGQVDLSLPTIAACVVLAVVLLAALGYAIAMYCMQQSLAARCAAQAGANNLQVLNIQGMQKRNMAYAESTAAG